MKTVFLRINSAGRCQPHQCAVGASYKIDDVPGDATDVSILANQTLIAAPDNGDPAEIKYTALGRGRFVNLYPRAGK